MRSTPISAAVALTVLGLVAATGCQAQDRAGGTAGDHVVTISFAQPNAEPDPQLVLWAKRVDQDSHGMVKIAFKNGYAPGDHYESQTVKDIAAGKVDAGWVGARVFDRLGVTSFDPLLAPLLVYSQRLQGKVFEAGIPEEMLSGLGTLGVHGVGVLPGPLRRVLSKGQPLSTPAAFHGLDVGTADSAVEEQTFAALGATTTAMPTGADIGGVDAMEAQVGAIAGNHYEEAGGKSVVGNVNLYPRPIVLLMGNPTWRRLTTGQRTLVTHAARQTVAAALLAARADDVDSTRSECGYGLAFPQATADQLAALRAAVQPVYDSISKDATDKRRLDAIVAIKSRLGAPPDAAACGSASPLSAAGSLPDGTYESVLTGKEKCNPDGAETNQLVLKDGVASIYNISHGGGPNGLGFKEPFTVFRDKVDVQEFTMTWKLTGDRLVFSDLTGGECADVAIWTSVPWTRK